MDINAIWDAGSAVVGAIVAVGGAVVTWIKKNEKTLIPIVEAIGADPRSKEVVADVQAAIAAKDSALRAAEIDAAVKQALLVIGAPTGALAAGEHWIIQNAVKELVPANVQPYVTPQAVEGILNVLPAAITDARKSEWFQAVQVLRESAVAKEKQETAQPQV